MFNNYRQKRARAKLEEPLKKQGFANKSKFAAMMAVVLAMAAIVYCICFAFRATVIPNMMSRKSTQFNLISTINFSYTSDLLTRQKRDLNAERIPPYYKIGDSALKNADESINKLLAFFAANQGAYDKNPEDKNKGKELEEISNSLRKTTSFEVAPEDIAAIYSNLDEKARERTFKRIAFYVRNILRDGVYPDNDKVFSDSREWLNPTVNVSDSAAQRAVSQTRALRNLAEKMKNSGVESQLTGVLYRLFSQCLKPDIEFDAAITKQKRDAARAEIPPVVVQVREGETLADSDSLSTPLAMERLAAYRAEIARRGGGDLNNIPRYINFLLCFLLMLLAALFITISKTQRNKKARTIYVFCTLLVLNLLAIRAFIAFTNTSMWDDSLSVLQLAAYATPIILGPIVQVLLFGSYLGFIMAILISTLATLMLSETLPFFILSLTASVVAIYLCDGATNRYRVILTGAVYGLFVAVVLSLMGVCMDIPLMMVGRQAVAAFIGGMLTSILALALLPAIETIFGRNSNISLIDYTDMNNKKAALLKTLQLTAPGTYHHSVMVSYIAEAAAQAVKANSMVCKVGALYHDIGKLSKPEFFSENQGGENPHDDQNPTMSALIIKNHVSDGVAKAEVDQMPRQIIDAIGQHHGTSVISYFYRKAMNKAGEKTLSKDELNRILREEGIDESSFRYDGKKPQTVENAIIMIADSCEAASRSMKKITKHGVDSLVEAIVNDKTTDGQFDECPITVKQISVIKKSVAKTIMDMSHSRVDYRQV